MIWIFEGADLQLVEFVLSCRQTGSTHGSHYQPGVAAGRSRTSYQARRQNDALSDTDARRKEHTHATNRQYPSSVETCSPRYGAIAYGGQMEGSDRLHRRQNHPTTAQKIPQNMPSVGGVTAVFRLNRPLCGQRPRPATL